MDLTLSDSKVLEHLILDSLKRTIGEDGAEKTFAELKLKNEKSNRILHSLNEILVKSGYGLKTKNVFEKLSEELSSRLDVKIRPDNVSLLKDGSEHVLIEVINRFDVPLIFEVTIEDRDNFVPVVFNKLEGAYFNNFTLENIIDTGDVGRFRFKLGWEGQQRKIPETTLFVLVRSKEVEGLNWIGKLKVNLS